MLAKAKQMIEEKKQQQVESKTVSKKFRPSEIQSTGLVYRDKLRQRLVDILRLA